MWIDPGFGFGKRQNDNFKLLANLDQLLDVHFNICAGLSRKSMIGYALGDNDLPRHNATACANLLAWQKGARMFRVHDVQATKDAIMIAEQVAKGLM
jgi:dihydropteroate synthase